MRNFTLTCKILSNFCQSSKISSRLDSNSDRQSEG